MEEHQLRVKVLVDGEEKARERVMMPLSDNIAIYFFELKRRLVKVRLTATQEIQFVTSQENTGIALVTAEDIKNAMKVVVHARNGGGVCHAQSCSEFGKPHFDTPGYG
jgi:hypothetical protein